MLDETRNVPGLPGAEDVADGNVDYYEMDWENIENGATEEQMQKCIAKACGDIGARCADRRQRLRDHPGMNQKCGSQLCRAGLASRCYQKRGVRYGKILLRPV